MKKIITWPLKAIHNLVIYLLNTISVILLIPSIIIFIFSVFVKDPIQLGKSIRDLLKVIVKEISKSKGK